MRSVLAASLVLSVSACRPVSAPPEDVLRRAVRPTSVELATPLGPGARLRMKGVEIEIIRAGETGPPADLAEAARTPESSAPLTKESPPALAPTSEEPAWLVARAISGGRRHGVACAAGSVAVGYARHAIASLSCAIVREAAAERFWSLTVRTKGHEQSVQRYRGLLEPRDGRGPIPRASFFRVASSDEVVESGGRDTLLPNAYFTVRSGGNPVTSARTRAYGAPPKAWLDAGRVDSDHAEDAALLATAILMWVPWPEG